MIDVKDVKKNYGDVQALKGVNFSVVRGEIVGLLGPNGAGKTTLMKILTGYLLPSEGSAKVGDFDVVENRLAVQNKIGYLPENAPLYLEMSVQDYLVYIAHLRKMAQDDIPHALKIAVKRAGLQTMLTRQISTLSKGYRQRVGIAQAIIHQPELLILDEPTNGLDPTQIVEIRQLIKDLAQESTVILSSHILSEVQLTCQRVVIIHDGLMRLDQSIKDMSAGASVCVEISEVHSEAEGYLKKIPGVSKVENRGSSQGYVNFWVESPQIEGEFLNRAIFKAAKENGWDLQELHRESRSLEQVFQGLVSL